MFGSSGGRPPTCAVEHHSGRSQGFPALTRPCLCAGAPSLPSLPPPLPSCCPGLVDGYSLGDLQAYLQQYPAAHYSHGGKEPLLYVVVLLLSLQFRCGRAAGLLGAAGGWAVGG